MDDQTTHDKKIKALDQLHSAQIEKKVFNKTSNSFEQRVADLITKKELIKHDSTIIVGLSGGPDSVCLLILLKKWQEQLRLNLIAAHLDHGWRARSAQDALFCKEFSHQIGVPFEGAQAHEIIVQKKYNGSKEEQGRLLRRQFFKILAQKHTASVIALGHHQDDQQETFLLRMIRGASIAGLASMRPKDGLYIRPLLGVYKQEIIAYLSQEQAAFLHDETNDDKSFLRNALRHTVLPALKNCDTRFDLNFSKMIDHIQQTDDFLDRLAHARLTELYNNDAQGINYNELLGTDSFLHHRIILLWMRKAGVPFTPSTAFFDEILRFIRSGTSRHAISPSWYLEKKKEIVTIIF